MNCVDIQNLLSAYIDGECSDNEKRIIEEHLKQCSDCIEEYRLLKTLIGDLNNIEEIDLPDGFHNDLMDKIKSSTPIVKKKNRRGWYSVTAAAFLFIIIFGVIGTTTLTRWINYSKDDMMYDAADEPKMEESSEREVDKSAPMTKSTELESDMISLDQNTNNEVSEEEAMMAECESEKEEFSIESSDGTVYLTATEDNSVDYSGGSMDEDRGNNNYLNDKAIVGNPILTTSEETTQVDEDEKSEERTSNNRLPMKNLVLIIVVVLLVISIPIIIIIYSVRKRTKK